MALFDVLGQRWTLRILWELRVGRLTFRELRTRCEDISPTVLNRRLKELRALQLLDHHHGGYGYTTWGRDLSHQLETMNTWSDRWAAALQSPDR
jgi:DNA-binding HxlR family transcriptional regulator